MVIEKDFDCHPIIQPSWMVIDPFSITNLVVIETKFNCHPMIQPSWMVTKTHF
jgi:hypothetical protein